MSRTTHRDFTTPKAPVVQRHEVKPPSNRISVEQYRALRDKMDRDNTAANRAALLSGPSAPKSAIPSFSKGKPKNQEESKIQVACVRWFRAQHPRYSRLLFAIRNGGRESGTSKERAIKGKRNIAEGVVPGAADLLLSIARGKYHGLYLEMKAPGEYPRATQREFRADVQAQGYGYLVPKSLEEFEVAVITYLNDGALVDLKAFRKARKHKDNQHKSNQS